MKKAIFFLVLSLTCGSAFALARTWTNQDGKQIEAELVSVDGDKVILRKGDKNYTLTIASLSEEDQTFIRESQEMEETEETKDEPTGETAGPREDAKFPLKTDQWVAGEKIDPAEAAGKPVVLHPWQAHCGACPPSLKAFEKTARRKKRTGAVFMVWHSVDKIELARSKNETLDLELPIYHGQMLKWDEKFGEFVWPHVIVMKPNGEIAYMGKANRDFENALKEVTDASGE